MLSKWDKRFLRLAKEVASWSKDPTTKCGAVLVRPDKTIASVGFNGFPRKLPDRYDLYHHREQKLARIIHAEMNAIRYCQEKVDGYTVYVWPMPPCDRCAAHLISHNIARVVSPFPPQAQAERWKEALAQSEAMYDEAGVAFNAFQIHENPQWLDWDEADEPSWDK